MRRNRINWTVIDLANTFNLAKSTVNNILQSYKAHRLRVVGDLRSKNGRQRKVSPAQEQWLVDPAQLRAMKHLNLRERTQLLREHHQIQICPFTLWRYYRKNNVRCIKVDLASTAKLGKLN